MRYPMMQEIPSRQETVEMVGGYNHNLRTGDGEFYHMQNMSSELFPVLSPRKPRKVFNESLTKPRGLGVCADLNWEGDNREKRLCFVDNGVFHIGNGVIQDLKLSDDGPKTIISMNGYAYIWPDKKYVNLSNWASGSLEAGSGQVVVDLNMCTLDGTDIEVKYAQESAPEAALDLEYWADTSGDKSVLRRYSGLTKSWVVVPTTYVKIKGSDKQFGYFDKFDGIKLTFQNPEGNKQLEDLQGYNIIWGEKDKNQLIVAGILDTPLKGVTLQVTRDIPDMDYVCASQNRIWGCRYDINGTNRIYACKLGDPKNWNCFMGASTDSWFVNLGDDGPFTGCAGFRGYPVFFKEGMIHRIYGDKPPFGLKSTPAQGVQQGCSKSIAVVDETMFYKGRQEVCIYDGTVPQGISEKLGKLPYEGAVGCGFGGKYYISMKNEREGRSLFVFDTDNGIWTREDDLDIYAMAAGDKSLYAIDGTGKRILILGGEYDELLFKEMTEPIPWMAQTGDLGLSDPAQKYISRLSVRLSLDMGAQVSIYIRYDNAQDWEFVANQKGTRLRSITVPIRPRRCDHMQLKFTGYGDCRIYSISKRIQKGTDAT